MRLISWEKKGRNIPTQIHDLPFENFFGNYKRPRGFCLPNRNGSIVSTQRYHGANVGCRYWEMRIAEKDMRVIGLTFIQRGMEKI
jgi:hypothetical protein